MTASTYTGTAGFLARYDALRDRLPGDPRQRDAAADAFRRAGLPGAASGRREEAWKYTSLRPVADASFLQPVTSLAGDSTLLARLPRIDAPRIVFVDGQFRPELSALPPGVEFSRFADRAEYGTLARARQRTSGRAEHDAGGGRRDPVRACRRRCGAAAAGQRRDRSGRLPSAPCDSSGARCAPDAAGTVDRRRQLSAQSGLRGAGGGGRRAHACPPAERGVVGIPSLDAVCRDRRARHL